MTSLVLTTLAGLEEAVRREAALRGLEVLPLPEGFKGRVLVEGPEEQALSMRTVEAVSKLLGFRGLDDLDVRSVRLALRELFRGAELGELGEARVRAYVFGEGFSRRTLELVAARELVRAGVKANRRARRSVRVELDCRSRVLAASLQLNEKPMHLRPYYRRKHPAPLNPLVAASAPLLADLPRGAVVYDPFCGSGTIPIEASLLLGAEALASDVRRKYAEAALENSRLAGADVHVAVGDVRAPPFRGGFDAVVADPPRGFRMRVERVAPLIEAVVKLAASKGVKAVMITPFFSTAVRLAKERGLKVEAHFQAVQGGERIDLLVLTPQGA